MDENNSFEIAWRELLVTRLKSVQTVLKRDSTAEKKRLVEARALAAGYETYEDAQNAYGYEEITLSQLEAIGDDLLEKPYQNKAQEALKHLGWVIGVLEGEVNTILYGDVQELQVKRYFEELEWKKQQTE